jgi:hypothetical protein
MPSPSTVAAVAMAMYDLQRVVTAEGRIRATTGGIFDRLTTPVSSGSGYVMGQLEGDDYWIYVGNGRGPGGMPPVNNIAAWVNAAGIDANPWAIAKSIAKKGTRNWRAKKTNIFKDGIDKWEKGGSLDRLEDVAGKEFEDSVVEVVRTNMKRNG